MSFNVQFTIGARKDLQAIHSYLAVNESVDKADQIAREIVTAALTLRDLPHCGAHPPELLKRGSRAYRQILVPPYRILYRIRARTVFVAVIADGRRDMASLLSRRLTSG